MERGGVKLWYPIMTNKTGLSNGVRNKLRLASFQFFGFLNGGEPVRVQNFFLWKLSNSVKTVNSSNLRVSWGLNNIARENYPMFWVKAMLYPRQYNLVSFCTKIAFELSSVSRIKVLQGLTIQQQQRLSLWAFIRIKFMSPPPWSNSITRLDEYFLQPCVSVSKGWDVQITQSWCSFES